MLPLIIGASLFMQTLDSTVIANALPAMARSLGEDPITLNLAITAYLLSAAVFMPISAWVADRYGPKNVFRVAILIFVVSSLCCGLSRNLIELVVSRMLQGVAGAVLLPVGRLVLLRSVPKSDLVRAMSYLTVPMLLGSMLGPPLGGFMVTYWSWRWIFFINLPIGALGLVLATLYIPDLEKVREPLDLRGFILTGCGLAGLVYGFDNLGRGVLPFTVVAAMLAGGVVCTLLYVPHAKRTPHAILDLSLLKLRSFAASTVGGLFPRLIIGSTPFLLALLLQVGFGLTAFQSGLLTFAGAVGALLNRPVAPQVIRLCGFKQFLVWNTILLAVISAGFALFRQDTPHWLLVAAIFVSGFFRSLQFTALNSLGYADVSPSLMSRASSFASMFQQLAASLGVGLAALLIHLTVSWRGTPTLEAADISPVFAMIAFLSLGALFFFLRLPSDAGSEVSGSRGPGPGGWRPWRNGGKTSRR